jgi:membrane-anchored protein YejM (alkaline phosphatase superfamily)
LTKLEYILEIPILFFDFKLNKKMKHQFQQFVETVVDKPSQKRLQTLWKDLEEDSNKTFNIIIIGYNDARKQQLKEILCTFTNVNIRFARHYSEVIEESLDEYLHIYL